ncbi:MAG: hypothetical protein ABIJ97_03130 [Bacteroidota bacterium]
MEFLAKIDETGKFNFYDMQKLSEYRRNNLGKEVVIDIDEIGNGYTSRARRFYWVLITLASQKSGYTKNEFHTEFKFYTGYVREIIGLDGKIKLVPKSIKKMKKPEFTEYIERLISYMVDDLGMTVDDPGEHIFKNHGYNYDAINGKISGIK